MSLKIYLPEDTINGAWTIDSISPKFVVSAGAGGGGSVQGPLLFHFWPQTPNQNLVNEFVKILTS